MRKKIAILGSTGSIGKSTLDIIRKDKKNFDVILLTANNNYKKLIQQAKQFKAKNVLIKNHKFYLKVKNSLKKTMRDTLKPQPEVADKPAPQPHPVDDKCAPQPKTGPGGSWILPVVLGGRRRKPR